MANVDKDVGTGGDYTTWAAFLAAVPADISTGTGTDEIWRGNGFNEAFDEEDLVVGAGVTTDATGYIVLRSKTAKRRGDGSGFDYTPGSGASMDSTLNHVGNHEYFNIEAEYTVIEDLEFTHSGNGGIFVCIFAQGSDDVGEFTVRGCVFHDFLAANSDNNRSFQSIFWNQPTSNKNGPTIHHNLHYGNTWGTGGASNPLEEFCRLLPGNHAAPSGKVTEVYNNVAIADHGTSNIFNMRSRDGTDLVCKNNISAIGGGSGNAFQYAELSGTITSDANMSDDTSANDNGDGTHYESETMSDIFTSLTDGSEDFHLKASTNAIGNGVDLGTSPDQIELDMDGFDRDAEGSTWDLGIDQTISDITVAMGLPSETDSALAMTRAMGVSLGLPSTTETALSMTAFLDSSIVGPITTAAASVGALSVDALTVEKI